MNIVQARDRHYGRQFAYHYIYVSEIFNNMVGIYTKERRQ
jgi:hypothetical protein